MRHSLIENYYAINPNYPKIVTAIGEAMRIFIAETLYSQESLSDALDRVVVADIGASTDEAFKEASGIFGTNQDFPFTAYNFGGIEVFEDRKNTRAALKTFFVDELNAFVYSYPLKQEFLCISFCNNPDDYERMMKLWFEVGSLKTVIDVAITINGIATTLPVRLSVTPEKGQYAHAFLEYIRTNGIWDIVHNFELNFHDIILDRDTVPIDEMIFAVEEKSPIDDSLNTEEFTYTHPRTQIPVVVSSDPTEDEEDVPVGNNIVLTFNVTMDEDSVNNAITIYPYFEHKIIWDDDSKILLLETKGNLQPNTEYTITIDNTAHAFHVRDNIDEYELVFTTEV